MISDPDLADLTPIASYVDGHPWMSRADLRMPFKAESNHDVQKLIVDRIEATLPGLLSYNRISFDSELSCFFVYGKEEEDCKDVIGVIMALIAEVP